MTQNTSHNVWQYAFNHSPILNDTQLTFSVETYLIHETGEVSTRFAMGASKLLSYYCDDNNSGSLAMASQFADYRTAFNGWIKNVALNAPMGHAVFNHGLEGRVCHENDGTVVFDAIDLDPWLHPAYDSLPDCSEF